jgi:hypothetical protein
LTGLYTEGQLKERSEGFQAQWQTALGEEIGSGVLTDFVKLAALLIARCVPKPSEQFKVQSSEFRVLKKD